MMRERPVRRYPASRFLPRGEEGTSQPQMKGPPQRRHEEKASPPTPPPSSIESLVIIQSIKRIDDIKRQERMKLYF